MKTMRIRTTPARYKLGKPHEKLAASLVKSLSNTMVAYNETDIIRISLEEFWKRANIGKPLPADVLAVHKMYHSDAGL